MTPEPDDEVWGELWGSLCHQGTVYSASFAALPAIEATARSWPANRRTQALGLAGAIVASNDVLGSRAEFIRGLEPTVNALHELALESVALSGYDSIEFIYLLEAVVALGGDRFWGQWLDFLDGGDFPAGCPACRTSLSIHIGEQGFFVDLDVQPPPTSTPLRRAVHPSPTLQGVAGQMHAWAAAVGQFAVAEAITYLFGNTSCPLCKVAMSVPDALATVDPVEDIIR
jgi:hypothetical protein